ncbi:Calcium/proton exchanger [Mycena kentingensis (nom. inval.)]|nr:Calcium/proton exchanger [Mycena kentingensis (nom. inval.)]
MHACIPSRTSMSSNGSTQPLVVRQSTVHLESGAPRSASQHSISAKPKPTGLLRLLDGARSFDYGSLFRPAHPLRDEDIPDKLTSLKNLASSWFNVLLVAIPISFALHSTKPEWYAANFAASFAAIIPLANLLSFCTEELSRRVGDALAGLINASLGNVVELIVAILALIKCELEIVQSSLIGSILGNLLLVLGMCFFVGGMFVSENAFADVPSQVNSSVLTLSVVAAILPAAFQMTSSFTVTGTAPDGQGRAVTQTQILRFSRGIAIILLCVYVCHIVFSLFTHKELSDEQKHESRHYPGREKDNTTGKGKGKAQRTPTDDGSSGYRSEIRLTVIAPTPSTSSENLGLTAEPGSYVGEKPSEESDVVGAEDDEEEKPRMHMHVCLPALGVITVLTAFMAEYLVDSIDGFTASSNISKSFVGIILLPIAGNIAEHVSAVYVSRKDKMTMSLGIAVGSSIQIALFVIPLVVLVGWGANIPMTLLFDPFEAVCILVSVLTVNYTIQDGKSNWMEGVVLICLYLIIGTMFFFYPGIPLENHFAACNK